ncbi:hypothetical protein C8039_15155 [Halogeometricum sp. wsp3]|nr:hypothetical protein C8039_15155 [Halogeometricum sp. wsp3]
MDAPERSRFAFVRSAARSTRGTAGWTSAPSDYTDIAIEQVSEALGIHVDAQSVAWQVAPEQLDKNYIRMHAEFSGVIRGTPVTEEVTVPVRISRQTCKRCGTIAGGSFASSCRCGPTAATRPTTSESALKNSHRSTSPPAKRPATARLHHRDQVRR